MTTTDAIATLETALEPFDDWRGHYPADVCELIDAARAAITTLEGEEEPRKATRTPSVALSR